MESGEEQSRAWEDRLQQGSDESRHAEGTGACASRPGVDQSSLDDEGVNFDGVRRGVSSSIVTGGDDRHLRRAQE
jgi:hypothetical protein